MWACFCVDIFSRISSVCSAFPHAHNCVFRTPNPASILSYSHTSAFPCSRIAAHHISARRWFACSCSRIPAPVSLHPCAQRPVPARSLAPARPVPARSLAPMRPAPGPGPVPCTHAPSARVRVVFPLCKPARTGAKRCEKRVKKPDGKPSGFSHGAAPHLFCMPSLKPAPRPLCARSPPP